MTDGADAVFKVATMVVMHIACHGFMAFIILLTAPKLSVTK